MRSCSTGKKETRRPKSQRMHALPQSSEVSAIMDFSYSRGSGFGSGRWLISVMSSFVSCCWLVLLVGSLPVRGRTMGTFVGIKVAAAVGSGTLVIEKRGRLHIFCVTFFLKR
ncbi:hypothetical protein JTE90_027980 [Oedothorax gibbosus]|uniref:Transmembrane protein n=1 Tax=Oedothorax gibbosus TaxID=931172 RepID=A0AAV6VF64_9ARAC|nr:hypothetical protein JTE90_027980 [Oedothorax gibbosus]